MRKKNGESRKLKLSKETLQDLEKGELRKAHGLTGAWSCAQSCIQECQLSTDTDPCTCGFCS